MSKFCVYAPGFVGSAEVTQDILVNSRSVQAAPGTSIEVSTNSMHPVNRRIIHNYVTLLRNPEVSQTFDFREKVIKDVKDAFGMPFLDAWFGACYAAGYMDPLRQRFLEETMNYICGKGRGMAINVYLSSIGFATEKCKVEGFTPAISDLLGVSRPDNALRQNTLKTSEVLQGWIAQPGGFNDLVTSAMIFWGDHSIR